MKRAELTFDRPETLFARVPPEKRGRDRDDVRLLVTLPDGHHHARFEGLPQFLRAGDLLVVNESAAIPASLPAAGKLGDILLNLCTRFRSDLWIAEPRWSAGKPGPLPIRPGDELRVGSSTEEAGVRFAPILLHTGVSSLEIEGETVESEAMYPEPFFVSRETADAVNRTHASGGRVIAVGTTVVRALESAWTAEGVRPRTAFTRLWVNPDRGVHAVDGLLTGFHDPVTSHLALLGAFLGMDGVRRAYMEATRAGYLWHEFGDSHLVIRGASDLSPGRRS